MTTSISTQLIVFMELTLDGVFDLFAMKSWERVLDQLSYFKYKKRRSVDKSS